MLYDISLTISYEYEVPADAGRHVLRMTPKDIPGVQRVIAATQSIDPHPIEWLNRVDFFGNNFIEIDFGDEQSEIRFDVKARVERLLTTVPKDASGDLSWLRAELEKAASLDGGSPYHFLAASSRVSLHPEISQYAKQFALPNTSTMQIALALGLGLHRDMKFDPEATTVDTPPIEAFQNRKGVCQDFTHIMIAGLRGIGIPAGYVSGFLRTNPPEGQPPLEGADAMHAWVQFWCGEANGWVEYDPTNGMFAAGDHIVIARGRDYSDVSPVKGLMRFAGDQTNKQEVTVRPL